MRLFKTLSARLTAAYATALFVGLCLFAAVSAFVLLRLADSALDARLRTTVTALSAMNEDSGPEFKLEATDKASINRVVKQLDAAFIRPDGSIALTTAPYVPPEVMHAVFGTGPETQTVHTPEDTLRISFARLKYKGPKTAGIAVWSSLDPLEDFKQLLILVFGVGIPAVVGLAILAGVYVTRGGLAPLRDIAKLASEIEARDLSRRLPPQSGDDELGSLSSTFDRMLDRMQAAFERQRRFTADASHELRAPLSIIRAEADLALRRSRTPDEYRRALESVAEEADRIEDLVGDLLAVARAEAGAPPESTTVNLAMLVSTAAERLESVAQSRGVRIDPALVSEAPVRGDGTALARVPLALLHNAINHARQRGCVRVALSRDDGKEVRLVVSDDGPGFSNEGLRRATERFWRDDTVRGRGGSGLGLAIVRAIVEQSGGSIELRNAPAGGAEVELNFPIAD